MKYRTLFSIACTIFILMGLVGLAHAGEVGDRNGDIDMSTTRGIVTQEQVPWGQDPVSYVNSFRLMDRDNLIRYQRVFSFDGAIPHDADLNALMLPTFPIGTYGLVTGGFASPFSACTVEAECDATASNTCRMLGCLGSEAIFSLADKSCKVKCPCLPNTEIDVECVVAVPDSRIVQRPHGR